MGLSLSSAWKQAPAQLSNEFLSNALALYPKHDFQVRLWDGSTWGTAQPPRFTLVLKHPGALRQMFLSPSELTLGESYIFDDFDIEGDIEAVFDLADYLLAQGSDGLTQRLHLTSMLRKLPVRREIHMGRQTATLCGSVHSNDRDRQAISYHYDLAPEFFALWLDQRMMYSVDHEFDKIVSVGMFEHVGEEHLAEYFSQVWQLLRSGGRFLNSGIAATATDHRQGPSFIDHYVFPDGELVPLSASVGGAERAGFEVRDVESLREHYALTLQHWVRRLEAHADEVRCITDETTYRIWRLYMAASADRFRLNRLNLYQMLLAKPLHGQGGMPPTRADWYRD
jgi:Mycolic acid cyclopropane synthetase